MVGPFLQPSTDGQVFLDKFFVRVYSKKIDNSSMPASGQGKFVRVYERQGKLDKCKRNTSAVLIN
jgi:hypothetical protein